MKKLIVYILLMGLFGFASAHDGQNISLQQKQQPVVYTCPMHPEIQSKTPGNCSKCGMKLVIQKKKSVPAKKAVPGRKTHPSKKEGMGGMKMSQQKAAVEAPYSGETYTCPMHPEVHASKPGNCPKCGMKLVKETQKTAPTKHEGMDMPMKEDAKKSDSMEGMKGMQMGDDNATMENIKKAKAQLGPIKTITSKTPPRTVRYDLYIADTTVTYGKKSKRAIAVNGQIPMPTLTFTEGDTALIYVHNNLDEETSLHWHGLFLPNKMDGVPFLTQMPIMPHATYIYKFPIVQHGTHWYHSHSMLQEQIGMYGAFIMNKRKEWDIPTIPLVLSEWTDMKPEEVHRSLKNATDWFAIQKGTTQSYGEAIKTGHFKTKVNNEWKRMTAMDVSDVYYDAFLINGKNQNEQPQFKAGDKVRLRIANGGASDYFWLSYSGGKITVVATDGNDVEPVEVDRLIIATSETYDVVVTIPENKKYEFLVTPEDRTKSASLWLGSGEKVFAQKLDRPKYFAGMKMMNDMMDMQGNMIEMEGMKMQNQVMDMNTVMYPEITGAENPKAKNKKTDAPGMQMPNDKSMAGMNMADGNPDMVTLNYNMLRDPKITTLPKGPWKELKFDLTGNMNRYVWTLDNKTVSESDKILIKKGENVRIIMFNNSMMRHPMHLHGHDFRVVNGQGENAPMKNVLDIMPMERDTIEFAASENGGDWFFHCHILYHMMSGMGRVFSYENSPPNPELPDPKLAWKKLSADDRKYHPMASIGLESNGSDGELMFSNTRYRLSTEWRVGLKSEHGIESETYFGRYIGKMQWLMPFVGFDYHYNRMNNERENNLFGQLSNQKNRKAAVIGAQFILPMLVTAEARLDSKGKLRFQLGREDVPLTSRLRFNFMANTDKEYMAGFRYIVTKYFSFSTHYDSDMGYGAGLTITY
ncbi:Copper-resistance protein CopA [Pedobacter sp. BAL39]|uniref:multicopper oxidase domain-containing protein n=1 Tax=Pedobacter sp. BAL39 TaxID=391596 RepID=UPI000155A7CA|nr:multicopper oxidase domain-containing protein [Pedobacter sp. BAL39]EDM34548.1 Copper-resistance protein CopA [Pedobacter sp. BAL39]